VPEADVVAATAWPRTRQGLAADLRRLGLESGTVVLAHSSLSTIGWVSGGAETVIAALRDVLTASGTLVMPAQSNQLSDPAGWAAPAIPADWHAEVRASLPAFDPLTTPTREMGAVAELFRTWPGALRSHHPSFSFAALGPQAEPITRSQPLGDPFGEASPLGRLYALGAQVLLLGVGYDRCTALHLAERRAWPDRDRVARGAPMLIENERHWVVYETPPMDEATFPEAGAILERQGLVTIGVVGSATSRLLPIVGAINAVTEYWRRSSGH
jgi:aminoglycoside 3-N-acetyltransferase